MTRRAFVDTRWQGLLLLCLLLGLGLACAPCRAQGELPAAAEYQIKAAFLYKFAGFVEWPEGLLGNAGEPLTIGVAGADLLAAELQQAVQGRTVNERPVAVRKLKAGDPLAGVHILFVGRGEAASPRQLQAWVQLRPVLLVTESEGALEHGSMINFVVVERRVRFEIALDAAEKSSLRLSSRLLAVAYKVVGSP